MLFCKPKSRWITANVEKAEDNEIFSKFFTLIKIERLEVDDNDEKEENIVYKPEMINSVQFGIEENASTPLDCKVQYANVNVFL